MTLAIVEFFNKATAPPGLLLLPSGGGVVPCDKAESERFAFFARREQLTDLPEQFSLFRCWEQSRIGIWRPTDSFVVTTEASDDPGEARSL